MSRRLLVLSLFGLGLLALLAPATAQLISSSGTAGTGSVEGGYCVGSWVGAGAVSRVIASCDPLKLDCILIHEEGRPPLGGGNIISGFLWFTDPTTIGGGTNNHPGLASKLGTAPDPPGTVTSNVAGSFTTTLDAIGKQYRYLGWRLGTYIFSGYYDGDGAPTKDVSVGASALTFFWAAAVEVFTVAENAGPSGGKTSNVAGPSTDWYLSADGLVLHGLQLNTPSAGFVRLTGGIGALNQTGKRYYYWAGASGAKQGTAAYSGTAALQSVAGFAFTPQFAFVLGANTIAQAPGAAGWSAGTDITAGQQDIQWPYGNHFNAGPIGEIRQPADWPALGIAIDAGTAGLHNNVAGVSYGVVYFQP